MATKDGNNASVFNGIAESWYRLRHWTRFKTELEELAARWGSGRLLNIGCAHGPDFLPFKDIFDLYGLDSSDQMLRMAVKYSDKFKFPVNLLTADAVHLPIRTHSFDWVIAVAVYHHIESKEDRGKAFEELRRVLKPGGEAFITVWNYWQWKFFPKGKQVIVPWRTESELLPRYHYLYDYVEIEWKLKKHGFKIIWSRPERSYNSWFKYFSQNICVLVKPV